MKPSTTPTGGARPRRGAPSTARAWQGVPGRVERSATGEGRTGARIQPVLAIIQNLNLVELAVIALVAVLLFGKRLPEVAGQAASGLAKARRSLNDLRRQTGIDEELRQARRAFEDAERDAKRSARELAGESWQPVRPARAPDAIPRVDAWSAPRLDGGPEPQLDPNAPASTDTSDVSATADHGARVDDDTTATPATPATPPKEVSEAGAVPREPRLPPE